MNKLQGPLARKCSCCYAVSLLKNLWVAIAVLLSMMKHTADGRISTYSLSGSSYIHCIDAVCRFSGYSIDVKWSNLNPQNIISSLHNLGVRYGDEAEELLKNVRS